MKSYTDPILPSNMFSWREIGKAEKLNMERLATTVQQMNATLTANATIHGFSTANAFSKHYNTYANGLTSNREYNFFYRHSKLDPIAHLFKWIVKDRVSRYGNISPVADFGILKSHYEYYRKNGKPPDVFNRGRAKKSFHPKGENTRTKMEFPGGGALDVPKNEIYTRFRDGIKAANAVSTRKVTVPEMTLLAMQMFMEERPDVFGNIERDMVSDENIRRKTNSRISGEVSPELVSRMSEVIARYNSVNTTPITQSNFLELAIKGMLDRLPVELTDPELADRLKGG